jgi:hypothetical protein
MNMSVYSALKVLCWTIILISEPLSIEDELVLMLYLFQKLRMKCDDDQCDLKLELNLSTYHGWFGL